LYICIISEVIDKSGNITILILLKIINVTLLKVLHS